MWLTLSTRRSAQCSQVLSAFPGRRIIAEEQRWQAGYPWPQRRFQTEFGSLVVSAFIALMSTMLSAPPAQAATVQRYQQQDRGLNIVIEDSVPAAQRADVLRWLTETADSMAGVLGHWPRQEWQVTVARYNSRGNDPVPWAQVNRGNPDTVTFYVDPSADYQMLSSDWTAYHEFSHLLLPYRGWGDMWFSEGLASYYQNLLQARYGVMDEETMWQRLHDGFVRGRENKRPDITLAALSPIMREQRSYMRVYWSGAWYFFKADTELRQRTGGEQSLDTALGALNACCADEKLSAKAIARKLDILTGQQLFLPLFTRVANSYALPPFETLYQELGISIVDGEVALTGQGSASGQEGLGAQNLRRGIVQGVTIP